MSGQLLILMVKLESARISDVLFISTAKPYNIIYKGEERLEKHWHECLSVLQYQKNSYMPLTECKERQKKLNNNTSK